MKRERDGEEVEVEDVVVFLFRRAELESKCECVIRDVETMYGNGDGSDGSGKRRHRGGDIAEQMFPMTVFNTSVGGLRITKLFVSEDERLSTIKVVALQSISGFSSFVAMHVLGKGRPQFMIFPRAEENNEESVLALHEEMHQTNMFAYVELSNSQGLIKTQSQLVLVPVKREGESANNNNTEKRSFLIYSIPADQKDDLLSWERSLFSMAQLPVVFGLDLTLLRYYDLQRSPPPREGEIAMLAEFDLTGQITLPGGRLINAILEETVLDEQSKEEDEIELKAQEGSASPEASSNVKQDDVDAPFGSTGWKIGMGDTIHPVLYLYSSEGSVVFTKILLRPGQAQSFIVHIRPGWVETKAYILKGSSDLTAPPEAAPPSLFRVHVLAQEPLPRRLALELWRLLDPQNELIHSEHRAKQLVSRPRIPSSTQSPDFVALDSVMMPHFSRDIDLCFGVDCSSRWSGSFGISRMWPITAYDPYISSIDSGLSITVHFLHELRNGFYTRCSSLEKNLQQWLTLPPSSSILSSENKPKQGNDYLPFPPPDAPDVGIAVSGLKHRWLKGFQAVQSNAIPKELASARDYADPALRNKWHAIVDTNVLHTTDKFELFQNLEKAQKERLILVIPFVTVHELDWQKHNSKKEDKQSRAQDAIKFINQHVTSGSKFVVLQSAEEDAFCGLSSNNAAASQATNFNGQNDLRVYECAKLRHTAGLKTILISDDINLRNVCLSSHIPSVSTDLLWRLMTLDPNRWPETIRDLERNRIASLQQQQQQQQPKPTR